MKSFFLILSFMCIIQLNYAQQNRVCPPPKHQKGQTSAEINAETRAYIECVKNYKKMMNEEKERRQREKMEAEQKKRDLRQAERESRDQKQRDARNNAPEVQGK